MAPGVVLCADLGAGSLRVGAVTPKGTLVASASAALRAQEPAPGWSVADADAWWRALARTASRTLDALPRRTRVEGLCLAGLTRTQVLLDRDGRVLAPALLFRDHRAVDESAAIAPFFATDNPADAITAFHPLARVAWFAFRQPALFEQIYAVADPKDFLNFRLTGVLAGDDVTQSRLDELHAAGVPLPPWLARCRALLAPRRIAPWRSVGVVTATQPPFDRLAGVPVFAGSMDTWASAVGAGAVRAGQGYDIAGTSEVAGLVTSSRAVAPGLVSLGWGERVHQVGGPTQAGADSALWCHRTLRVRGSLAAAVERAGALAPTFERPLFLPYLAGERAPLWRADLRGAFEGISRASGPDDFLWAVLEGVAMTVREILGRAAECAGDVVSEVRVAGGGAQSDAWCAIKADVIGVPVVRTAQAETGMTGAAIAAAVGLGWHSTLAAAADAMCAVERVFEPRAAVAPIYAQRAERHLRARRHAVAQADAAGQGQRAD